MVFKPSFKCLKNKKIKLSPAFLKLETLETCFYYFILYYIRRAILIQKKKKWSKRKKNMPNKNTDFFYFPKSYDFILCVNLFIILLFFEILNNITLCAEPSFCISYIFCVEFTFFVCRTPLPLFLLLNRILIVVTYIGQVVLIVGSNAFEVIW